MARSLDQEPNLSASDNSQPNWGPHPERLPTDFGGTTPAHPDWQPDPLDKSHDPKSKNKLIAVITATGVGAVAIAGAALFSAKNEVHELGNKLAGADAANSAPELPGQDSPEHKTTIDIDAATPDQFYSDANFTDEQRVDWAWNKINQPSHEAGYEGMTLLQAAHKKLADSINNKPQYGNVEFLHELVDPSESMTGDQILTYKTTVSYLSATADMSDSDRAKILAASSDNASPNLQGAITGAEQRDVNSMSGTSEVQSHYVGDTKIKNESPVFRHYKTASYDPAGIPSKVMDIIPTSSGNGNPGDANQMIVHFINGKPTIVDVYPANSAKRIKKPDTISPNS